MSTTNPTPQNGKPTNNGSPRGPLPPGNLSGQHPAQRGAPAKVTVTRKPPLQEGTIPPLSPQPAPPSADRVPISNVGGTASSAPKNSAQPSAGIAPQNGKSAAHPAENSANRGEDALDDVDTTRVTFHVEELKSKQPLAKPYFMPEDLALEELSPTLRTGFEEIVDRAYVELVVGEQNPLARLVASTAVFETAMSLVSQAELASAVFEDKVPLQELHAQLSEHEKIVKRQMRSADFLQQREKLQQQKLRQFGVFVKPARVDK